MTKTERETMDELLHQLCTALPFVEDAQEDECFNPAKVKQITRNIRATIERAETLRKSQTIETP
jgi:hypothetical protein